MSNELLTILGGIITFLLSVNAYYFKDVVNTLTDIKIVLAKLTTEHHANSLLINKHDREIDLLREKIHKLEGNIPTMIKMIESFEEEKE